MIKAITILALFSLAMGIGGAGACNEHQNRNDKPIVENQKTDSGEIKTLAEGFQSSITDPFVAVIRDEETYVTLRKHEANLPKLEAEFFRLNIVVAAFLGTRNTGGYSVEISRDSNGQIWVAEKAPDKGAMVSQVITSPFKLVSLEPKGTTAVPLASGDIFQQRSHLYRISRGNFNMSGGFSNRKESFQLNGKLQVTRLGDLITIGFAMVSSGGERERSLRTSATGMIKEGRIMINRMSYGSLIDPPSGELQVSGRFSEGNGLTLDFVSKPLNIPESYGGGGSILAELVAVSAN
jgi:protease stability complex PrcB-like protein